MSEYKVALDVYKGPLDLLLFLIRREEVDIYDIPIARITRQYLETVEVLQQLDPESVSEFLVLAATLMEVKSRTLLPRPPAEESDDELIDPRLELVRQLLEYKKYKDAAHDLGDSVREQALKYARSPALPEEPPDELELDQVDLWDLVDAFRRVLEQIGKTGTVHTVGIDDTPIALHAEDILDSVEHAGGTQKFEDIFAGRTRAEVIGLFVALLELIRQRRVRVSQDKAFGTIHLHLLDRRPLDDVLDEAGELADGTVPGEEALAIPNLEAGPTEESAPLLLEDSDMADEPATAESGASHDTDVSPPAAAALGPAASDTPAPCEPADVSVASEPAAAPARSASADAPVVATDVCSQTPPADGEPDDDAQ